VVVLGKTGRNFAAGMSGGIAYVYDLDGAFKSLCNGAMVSLGPVAASANAGDQGAPSQQALSVEDSGMGDMLAFDAERLKILVERHLLHTGSARARRLLDNWDQSVTHFVKVTPNDFRRALLDLRAERQPVVAAE
jgi:glutamate synthase (NADPH/NADH) large chain